MIDRVKINKGAIDNQRLDKGALDFNRGSAAPSLPVNLAPPVIAGTPRVQDTLTATPGTWQNANSVTANWQLNGVDIGGQTALMYTILFADRGSTLTYLETATNAAGSVTQTSNGIPISLALDAILSGLVFQIDPTIQQTINAAGDLDNIMLANPNDGSAISDYNFSGNGNPTRTGTGSSAYMQVNGSQWWTITNGNTQFLESLHKDSGTFPPEWTMVAEVLIPNLTPGGAEDLYGTLGGNAAADTGILYSPKWLGQPGIIRADQGTASQGFDIFNDQVDLNAVTLIQQTRDVGSDWRHKVNGMVTDTGLEASITSNNPATYSFEIFASGNGAGVMINGARHKSFAMFNVANDAGRETLIRDYYLNRQCYE